MRIAIVGHGFVGQAVEYGFSSPNVDIQIIDPKYNSTLHDINFDKLDAVFVCVPTPTTANGLPDVSIVQQTVQQLNKHFSPHLKPIPWDPPVIIIKSTIPPAMGRELAKLNVVINPEFLTERAAKEQFVNPDMHVFGCDPDHPLMNDAAERVYQTGSSCHMSNVFKMTGEEACFVKYSINSFLAMKVTFFNQLYDAVANSETSAYNSVARAVTSDPRIGRSHSHVPGFDNKRGYGGACLPKDTRAFANTHHEMDLLNKVDEINNQYRHGYELDDREVVNNVFYNGQAKEEQS